MQAKLLSAMNALKRDRRAAIRIAALDGSSDRLVTDADDLLGDPLAEELEARFRSGKSGLVETTDGDVFLTVQVPEPRIVCVGAVHISQALAAMAAIAGFHLIVVDPRTAFATPERFSGVDLHAEWPEDILPSLKLDRYTAFAALTHDPKIDDWALAHALSQECFYVGALGSRKTHAKRKERLLQGGVTEVAYNRIHAPIGLHIGAASPQEIAIAVLGEIIAALRLDPQTGLKRSAA